MRLLIAAVLLCASVAAAAAEVAGVKLDERARIESRDLVLNGAGLRTRYGFVKVYVIGLYLPEKKTDAAGALGLPGPKRAAIRMLRDVGAEQFTDALRDGMRANVAESEFRAVEPRIRELAAIMAGIGEAKQGMAIDLDWTAAGTQLLVQGKPAGQPIAGEDFYRALLKIWLGDRPVQDDLKKALLGG